MRQPKAEERPIEVTFNLPRGTADWIEETADQLDAYPADVLRAVLAAGLTLIELISANEEIDKDKARHACTLVRCYSGSGEVEGQLAGFKVADQARERQAHLN